ncbi:hypothetical protein GmHk_04G010094 [Glycine max]|nr:hypothetical protein GmHk_04G010094 [Glycine max]
MLVSLHLLLFCRLQVAHFMVELMNQAVLCPLKNQHMKLNEDFLDSNRANITTSKKISRELTLVINSTKTRVDHQIGHHNNGLISMRGQQSWMRLLLNSCSTELAINNLEIHVGQLAKQIADNSSSKFRANTENNPKEECKAVMTRGKMATMAKEERMRR